MKHGAPELLVNLPVSLCYSNHSDSVTSILEETNCKLLWSTVGMHLQTTNEFRGCKRWTLLLSNLTECCTIIHKIYMRQSCWKPEIGVQCRNCAKHAHQRWLVGAYDENACTKKTPNKWSWLLTNLNPSGTNYIYATITIIILISAIKCNYNNYTSRRRLGTPWHSHM